MAKKDEVTETPTALKFFTDFDSISFENLSFTAVDGVLELPANTDPAWLAHLQDSKMIVPYIAPQPPAAPTAAQRAAANKSGKAVDKTPPPDGE